MPSNIRVRFAPSPTGPLHIGGLRTALYNYLYAKHHNGDFILRIEDTDQNRFVPQAEEYIINSLDWAGIKPDESPQVGGDFGPYRQSERKETYRKYADQLIESKCAYYAFDSSEELEAARMKAKESGKDLFKYDSSTRMDLRNSLTLRPEETESLLDQGVDYVIRLLVEPGKEVQFNDHVRGKISVNSYEIDDKVLLKSDGMPTYHLANVVDDYNMKISTVIRGEEWLPSTPLHVLLYQAFGWESEMPEFAHLPLLLKPSGNGKLSKRDGEKLGIPVFPLNWEENGTTSTGFKESGYLAEATINFLALLGWNPGTEDEIFSLEELISEFDLSKVNKAGSKFDIEKARWFNEQYIRNLPIDTLEKVLRKQLEERAIEPNNLDLQRIASSLQERISFPNELLDKALFYFQLPREYDEKTARKKWSEENAIILSKFIDELETQYGSSASADEVRGTLEATLLLFDKGIGQIMQPLRLAITGQPSGPDLIEMVSILGPNECKIRIEAAKKALKDSQESD